MEILQDNLILQIALLAIGLTLAGYFGYRSYRDRRKKNAAKRGPKS